MEKTLILSSRLANNMLTQPVESAEKVLESSLGVQAQYLNHGLFNIMNRLKDLTNLEAQALAIGWGQRQTVHYYQADKWLQIISLLNKEARWPQQHLLKLGVQVDESLEILAAFLKEHGPSSRQAISQLYGEDWQHLSNWSALFLEGSRRGQLLMRRSSFASTDVLIEWRDQPVIQSGEALQLALLKDYFKAYGPASKGDAAHFFGVRQTFFTLDFDKYFAQMDGLYYTQLNETALPEVQLLGKFDPLLVAYRDKALMFDVADHAKIWKKAGQISALLLIHGKLAGTWRYQMSGRQLTFYVSTQQNLLKRQKLAIEQVFSQFAKLMLKEIKAVIYDKI